MRDELSVFYFETVITRSAAPYTGVRQQKYARYFYLSCDRRLDVYLLHYAAIVFREAVTDCRSLIQLHKHSRLHRGFIAQLCNNLAIPIKQ